MTPTGTASAHTASARMVSGAAASSQARPGGDRILVGADVVTMDPARPSARALGIRGGRIAAVGTAEEVRAALPPGTPEADLRGLTVVPGFVDGHCHLEMTCQALDHHVFVQAPPVTSLHEILNRIVEERAARPTGWLIFRSSFMLQDKVVEGRLPDREDLDRVSPAEPVVVLAGLHVACLNSVALAELGLLGDADLPGWMTVHRRADGEPTGVVTEVWDRLPVLPADDVVTSLRRHLGGLFVAAGVTSVSTIPTSAQDVRALHRLAAAGELPLRVRFYVHVPRVGSLDTVLAWGPGSGFGDDMLRFGGVKIFVDGEGADGLGTPIDDTKWSRDELFDLVRAADRADVQLFMHAVTPRAIRLAAEAVAAARADRPRPDGPRHRIEHGADYLDPADLPRLREIGVGLVTTPHFTRSGGVADPAFQPLRAILDAGIEVIGSSDSTGTVPDGIAPLHNIAAAVTRYGAGGVPSPHRVTAHEALSMFTTWAAHGAHEERHKGAIRPGTLADLAVLSANPLTVAPEALDDISVRATVLGGDVVYGAGEEWAV
ncbi:amidohydrolase family protein [Streptosporangium sp. NPDC051022]|uniref:amidohydrolase n=1 Tax=Streptosporangium sp. NPDC051022 TaxID=3155752 RepID=UPI00343A5789